MKNTLRSYLDKSNKLILLVYLPVLMGSPIIIRYVSDQTPTYIILSIFILLVIYIGAVNFIAYRYYKCPKCSILLLGLYSCKKGIGFQLGLSEDVKYCPGCALSLDEPINKL